MAIKTDMSKSYDRVEWAYLKGLLLAMGFDASWVKKVKFCVTYVTFSVIINDQPFGKIRPKYGLRQEDLLSPFLFVICTEGLIHELYKVGLEKELYGIQFSGQGPMIHHMLFADDIILVCRATKEQATVLIKIMESYGISTRQKVY